MKNNNSLHGLRKRDTYNSLVGYLDGGQEKIKYPDRLATQIANAHQLNNLLNDEGKGWFEDNIEQQRRFAEQQVQDVVVKENLEEGQTFQEQKILRREAAFKRQQEIKKHDEDIEWERREDAKEHREIEIAKMKAATEAQKKKEEEEGIVYQFKQNVKSKLAQEAAAYLIKKGIEKLPSLIASLA